MLSHLSSQLWDFLPPSTTESMVEEIEVMRRLLAILMLVLLLALRDVKRTGRSVPLTREKTRKYQQQSVHTHMEHALLQRQ